MPSPAVAGRPPTRGATLRARACFRLALAACAALSFAQGTAAQASPRERVSFNAGWRFRKDDPPGAEGRLAYEKIKPWVTATGREFAAGEAGHKLSARLSGIVREEDPTRPVTAGANYTEAGYNGFQKTVDVFGFNYKPFEYGKFRQANPRIPFYASETASTVSSRGEYFFPVVEDRLRGRADFQVRVPSRSSYFGIVDLAGFKKDRFYIYQARWRPELPLAHILPHWNWPGREGQTTPVHVYTSGDEAELFLNGRSMGRRRRGAREYRLRWDDVKYEPGELRAVAYRGGRRWAESSVRTTGPAARLSLAADRAAIRADGTDLSFVAVRVEDGAGLTVPRAKNRIRFELDGPGEIVAVDNGDATSHEPFRSKERAAYNGLCLVVVLSKAGAPGPLRLRARSEGLAPGGVSIRSTRARRTGVRVHEGQR
jgi:hypothetical protein